jgi:hypothetical protein
MVPLAHEDGNAVVSEVVVSEGQGGEGEGKEIRQTNEVAGQSRAFDAILQGYRCEIKGTLVCD